MTVSVDDDGRQIAGPGDAPAAPLPRPVWVTRIAVANIFLAITIAVMLKTTNPPPARSSVTPLRDAARAWLPKRASSTKLDALTGELARLDEWAAGKRRYAETLAVLRPPVQLPVAGSPVATPFVGAVRMLVVAIEDGVLDGESVEFRDAAGSKEGELTLPARLGPFWQAKPLALRLSKRGGFFNLTKNESAWQPVRLEKQDSVVVGFPDAREWASPVRLRVSWSDGSAFTDASRVGVSPDVLDADIVDDRADWSLPWRSGTTRPRVQQLTQREHFNAVILEIRGRRRYVGVCFWSTSGRLPMIRARRSDSAQFIGVRGPDLPLFAAMTDRFAALQIELAADRPEDLASVQLVAVSSDDAPALPLFMETLGHALSPLRINDVTASAADHRRAGQWLRQVLGIEWGPREVEMVGAVDRELAAILTSLSGRRP